MAMPWIYAVRFAQILFGLIVVALTAYGKWSHYTTVPAFSINTLRLETGQIIASITSNLSFLSG